MKLLLFSACLKLLNSTPGDLRSANFTALLGSENGAACLNSIAKGDQGASNQPSATSWAMDAMDAMDGGNYNDTPQINHGCDCTTQQHS
jgi:hypothetical protein